MSLKEKYGKPANNGHAKPAFDADDVNARLAAEPIDDSPVPRFEEPAGWEFDGGARYTRKAGAGEQPQREAGDDETQPEHGGEPPRFPLVTARELATSKYETAYLIYNVLVANEFCILVAPLKTLKTSLAILLAVCLCIGHRLFDMFVIPERKRVAFFSGESGEGTIQSIFLRICASLQISPEGIDNFFLTFSVPRVDIDADLAAMEKFILDNRIEVAFCDCFYFMLGEWAEKASNLFAMGAVLRKLMDIQKRTGCTLVLLHHMPKHTACGEPGLDQAAFAGAAEGARQWILLNRMVPFDPASHRMIHKLWFVCGGSAGHNAAVALDIDEGNQNDVGGRSWSLSASWAHEARREMADAEQGEKEQRRQTQKEAELESDTAIIVGLLRELTEPETKTAIRDKSALSTPRFARAFASLLNSKTVAEVTTIKGNNRRYDGFLLAERAAEYRNGQQRAATGNPMLPDAVASEQATPLKGVLPDATPCDLDFDATNEQ